MTIEEQVAPLIEGIRKHSFGEGSTARDEECMGLLLAYYFSRNGAAILRSAFFALQESNYKKECAEILKMLKRNGAKL